MNLDALFEQTHNFPNIPKVVQELIDTFNSEDFDMEDIANNIGMDPVLTAKVLRLANSAHYGVSRTVSSTADASVLLGFSTLRTLVLASGITGAVQTPDGFDRKQFWLDNFTVAAISKWLAKFNGENVETAFTCGMLSSIGELLIQLIMPSEAEKIKSAVDAGGRLAEVEGAMLGYNYADVGAELATRWKFPENIVNGIRHHVDPLALKENNGLAGLTHLAVYIQNSQQQGLAEQDIINDFPKDVAAAIGLDTEAVMAEVEKLNGIESGMETLLNDL